MHWGCHNIYILVHMLWDTIIFKRASPHGGHNIHVLLHMAAIIFTYYSTSVL